jgi:hypothetical protein
VSTPQKQTLIFEVICAHPILSVFEKAFIAYNAKTQRMPSGLNTQKTFFASFFQLSMSFNE